MEQELNETELYKMMGTRFIEYFPIAVQYEEIKLLTTHNTAVTVSTAYALTFVSKIRKRSIEVRLVKYEYHWRSYIKIAHLEEGHNLLDSDDYLEEYCGVEKANEKTKIDDYEGNTLSEKLASYFRFLKTILDSRFYDIMEGKQWIDMPTNWHGYR